MLIQITTTTQHSISKEQNKKHRGACIFLYVTILETFYIVTHNRQLSAFIFNFHGEYGYPV